MEMPSPTLAPIERFWLTSSDGLCIACARWESRGPARGVAQIAHGMGEHMGRYADTIDTLVAAGLTVYANDHRGHGLSAHAQLGEFGRGGFELLVQDMVRLSEIAREENPDLPLLLLGHSMGSFAAQRYVIDHSHEIDGLILSGSGALDGLARAPLLAFVDRNLLNAAFEPARTPFDWLSRESGRSSMRSLPIPSASKTFTPNLLRPSSVLRRDCAIRSRSARSAAICRSICSPEAKTPSGSNCGNSTH